MALFRTAVKRASCGVHKLFSAGVVPTSLTSIVQVVADGLFCLCGSERWDELFIGTRFPLAPVPNRPYVASVDVKPYNNQKDHCMVSKRCRQPTERMAFYQAAEDDPLKTTLNK